MDKKPTSKSPKTTALNSSNGAVSKVVSKNLKPSQEQIAVRAYFISERRRELGSKGNEETDWLDAEKQLRDEAEAK